MSKVKSKTKQKWTKDMVKEVILDRRSKGLDITNAYFRKHKKPLYNAINRLYGTHAKAIEEIGLDYKEEFGVYPRGNWTDERIKNLVYQRLSKGQGIKTKEMM